MCSLLSFGHYLTKTETVGLQQRLKRLDALQLADTMKYLSSPQTRMIGKFFTKPKITSLFYERPFAQSSMLAETSVFP